MDPNEEQSTALQEEIGSEEVGAFSEDEMKLLLNTEDTTEQVNDEDAQAAIEGKQKESQKTSDEQENFQKTVPHEALHAEREEHKKTRANLQELQNWQREVAARLAATKTEQQQPEKTPEQIAAEEIAKQDPEPDELTDPLGHMAWKSRTLERELADFKNKEQQKTQETQQDQQFTQEWNSYTQELARDAAAIPEFQEAAQFLNKSAVTAFQEQGLSGEQINAALRQTEWNIAQLARQVGLQPAKMLLYIAQQHGFKAPDKAGDEAAAASAKAEAEAKLEKIAAAQQANQSLSGGGGAGKAELTVQDLNDMSAEELERFAMENPDLFEKASNAA